MTTSIQAEINALAKVEYAVETNEGTYGAVECCRATGSGDRQLHDLRDGGRHSPRRRLRPGRGPRPRAIPQV